MNCLGYDLRGIDLEEQQAGKSDANLSNIWKKQFTKKNLTPKDVMNEIVATDDAGVRFKLNFLVLFVNTLAECSHVGCCNIKFLDLIRNMEMIPNIDLSRYIYNCIARSKNNWRRDSYDSFYAGPLTFLTLLYVDPALCSKMPVPRQRPATSS